MLDGCKVTYFPIAGRAEPLRLALTLGGFKFTDERIPGAKWGEMKSTMPWGQMPLLTLSDGTQMAQSKSLLRFIGKQTSPLLYPTMPSKAQRVDELIDAMEDLAATLRTVGQGLDGPEKEIARKEACAAGGVLYQWLEKIEAFISANGSDGHAVGNSMTIADLQVFASSSSLVSGAFDGVPMDALAPFPKLQVVRKTVASHPVVVEWYDSRESSLVESEKVYRDARSL